MKIIRLLPGLLIFMMLGTISLKAQQAVEADSTGLPGENFSLAGALELFKKSKSPEQFEKSLNSENNNVNNLDLNNDGQTDYIRVINKKDGNVQIFVLQALVSDKESQDVAVIELEKTGTENAVVDITGDEDLYGDQVIVEPKAEDDNAMNYMPEHFGKQSGPSYNFGAINESNAVIINVWAWPMVQFVYAPAYVVWSSPWSWYNRPVWFRPWRPLAWHAFYPYRYRYYPAYAFAPVRRVVYAPKLYRPIRVTSVTVKSRNTVVVNNYRVNHTVHRTTVVTHNRYHGNGGYHRGNGARRR